MSDFPEPTEKGRRLEAIAIGAVLRRTAVEPYGMRSAQIEDSEGRVLWQPEPHARHANVETWIRHYPAHKRVTGFLLQGPLLGCWRVLAHSLVQVEDGSLIEITPQEGDQQHPFVRHTGTEEEFEEFADHGKLIVRQPP